MSYRNVIIEIIDNIGWLTINRPAQLNALNLETISEITDAIGQMNHDRTAKVVAITGAGDRAFVAGADIAAMREMDSTQATKFATAGHDCMRAIEECSKVVIAAVGGFALGGGTELALACDIIYASETAKFGLPEVKLGVYPGFGGTQRLPRLIGAAKAREIIFSGRIFDAAYAYEIGFANKVVPLAKLKEEVSKLAREIMANGPVAVALAKKLILEGMSLPFSQALNNEQAHFSKIFETSDRIEGLTAFLEKRPPCFSGK